MKKENRFGIILAAVYHYFVFFLTVAFVITCCITLFVSTLSSTLELTLTDEHLASAAKLTFVNVILLSLLFTLIDTLRRKLTVERPIITRP